MIAIAGMSALFAAQGASLETLGVFVGSSILYLATISMVLRGATGMMFGVVESNEWSRFHIVDLDATIRDHVGEDKLQIVTFRDRNRME